MDVCGSIDFGIMSYAISEARVGAKSSMTSKPHRQGDSGVSTYASSSHSLAQGVDLSSELKDYPPEGTFYEGRFYDEETGEYERFYEVEEELDYFGQSNYLLLQRSIGDSEFSLGYGEASSYTPTNSLLGLQGDPLLIGGKSESRWHGGWTGRYKYNSKYGTLSLAGIYDLYEHPDLYAVGFSSKQFNIPFTEGRVKSSFDLMANSRKHIGFSFNLDFPL